MRINATDNRLAELTVDALAPLCSLTHIDLNRTETPRCACLDVHQYLIQHRIRVDDRNASVAVHSCDRDRRSPSSSSAGGGVVDTLDALAYCADRPASEAAAAAFAECAALVHERVQTLKTKATWLWVIVALGAFLVLFMAALYALHLRNVRAQRLAKLAAAAAARRRRSQQATSTTTASRAAVAAPSTTAGTSKSGEVPGAVGRLSALDLVPDLGGSGEEALLQTTKV